MMLTANGSERCRRRLGSTAWLARCFTEVSLGNLAASLGTANNAGNHLSSVQQGLSSQMSVTLRCMRLSMAKKVLDHVKRHALVHEETGERVALIPLTELPALFRQPDYSGN